MYFDVYINHYSSTTFLGENDFYLHIYMLMNLIRRYNHPYGQYLDESIKQVYKLNQQMRLCNCALQYMFYKNDDLEGEETGEEEDDDGAEHSHNLSPDQESGSW